MNCRQVVRSPLLEYVVQIRRTVFKFGFVKMIYCFIICYDRFTKADVFVHSAPNEIFPKKVIYPSVKLKGS